MPTPSGDRHSLQGLQDAVAFPVHTLVAQRVIGIALGYEDLNDHEQPRHDPLPGAVIGKLASGRARCAPLAGKSTLNRLELFEARGHSRNHKNRLQAEQIEGLFVDLFLESYRTAPRRIVLDLDATDDPLHGEQEGRFFHGGYDAYCYLPLYIFRGRHRRCAKLRTTGRDGAVGALEEVERIVEAIRTRWPQTQIVLRADSGFDRAGQCHRRLDPSEAAQDRRGDPPVRAARQSGDEFGFPTPADLRPGLPCPERRGARTSRSHEPERALDRSARKVRKG